MDITNVHDERIIEMEMGTNEFGDHTTKQIATKSSITDKDITVQKIYGEFSIFLDGCLLYDSCESIEECKQKIPYIIDAYNNRMSNSDYYRSVTQLDNIINYHVKQFNNGGWKCRLDFNTKETYEAFIRGLLFARNKLLYMDN